MKNKVPVVAIVPVKDMPELTRSIVEQLYEQNVDQIIILDNGSTDQETIDYLKRFNGQGAVIVFPMPDYNIHQMWNEGVNYARTQYDRFYALIVNNDIEFFEDNCVERLVDALMDWQDENVICVCPNYDGHKYELGEVKLVRGTAGRHGGLAGFCFMLDSNWFESGYVFPEDLFWYYGDDDLINSINAAGFRAGIVGDAHIEHLHGGTNTPLPYNYDLILRHDKREFYNKWGMDPVEIPV